VIAVGVPEMIPVVAANTKPVGRAGVTLKVVLSALPIWIVGVFTLTATFTTYDALAVPYVNDGTRYTPRMTVVVILPAALVAVTV